MSVIDYAASLNEIVVQGMISIPSALYRNFEHTVINCEIIFITIVWM
jgi:hypothetical protein